MVRGFKFNVFIIICGYYHVFVESNHTIQEPKFEAKIVGGALVPLDMYPFAVQLFNAESLCGGAILNSWSVLTSAHCFDNNQDINQMWMQVGSKKIYDFNVTRYWVSTFVTHEDYNKEVRFQCDIAMVFSKNPIKFGNLAKKAILVNSDKWMNTRENKFIVTGWGWTKYGGPMSKVGLMMTMLKYVPLDECSRLHQINLTDDMFCLYGDGIRDTCKGDSGGGVLWNGMIVGLTSHGDGCAKKNKPSVYTNIWLMRPWIEQQSLKFRNDYCQLSSRKSID